MMRSRKVTILLALTAVTALTLFMILLLDSEAFGATDPDGHLLQAEPDTLDSYLENVMIGPDGDVRVEVTVVLAKDGTADLLLPFAFADALDFTILSGPVRFIKNAAGADQPTTLVLGHRVLNLETLPETQRGDSVTVGASVPGWLDTENSKQEFGEIALQRSYINRSTFFVREFYLGLRLEPGMRVHSVKKVQPAYDPKKSPTPPYTIGQVGDSGTITLQVSNLEPAAAASFTIHARSARRGPIPLAVGACLAVLYLVIFRDVLRAKEEV